MNAALKNGTKVQTVYGNWITVQNITDNIVKYYEAINETIHISKLQLSTIR